MSELAKYAKENKIKFFLFNFTDLFGTQRAKLVPAEAAGRMRGLRALPLGSTRRRLTPIFW
jgi:glutamine synthetase